MIFLPYIKNVICGFGEFMSRIDTAFEPANCTMNNK